MASEEDAQRVKEFLDAKLEAEAHERTHLVLVGEFTVCERPAKDYELALPGMCPTCDICREAWFSEKERYRK
jgi:hypothetical protein